MVSTLVIEPRSWAGIVNVAEYTAAAGGGTFLAETWDPEAGTAQLADLKTGYAVGISPKGLTIDQALSADAGYTYFGTWIEDDVLYVDVVVHTASLQSALAIGRAKDQIAIWDVANEQAISCR